jgi:ABC-type nitrate/sulfonate/bicarbonate transport system permease component
MQRLSRPHLEKWAWTTRFMLAPTSASSVPSRIRSRKPSTTAVGSGSSTGFSSRSDAMVQRPRNSAMPPVLGGFAIAAAIAVPLALLMAFSRRVGLLFSPIITFLRPIPPIAWIPIAILWFGIGDRPSYFITAIAAFFPIFINSYAGGHAVRPEHVHAARSLGAGPRALFLRIYLPSAMPMIATGLRIGLGQSWMAVVTAELIAAHSGLGYMIQANRLALETGLVLVGMCVIGLLGAAMSVLLEALERHVLVPWKVS